MIVSGKRTKGLPPYYLDEILPGYPETEAETEAEAEAEDMEPPAEPPFKSAFARWRNAPVDANSTGLELRKVTIRRREGIGRRSILPQLFRQGTWRIRYWRSSALIKLWHWRKGGRK